MEPLRVEDLDPGELPDTIDRRDLQLDLVSLDTGPRSHLDDATDERLSVVRSNDEVSRVEIGQSLGEGSRRMAELLVDLVRHQIPEALEIAGQR